MLTVFVYVNGAIEMPGDVFTTDIVAAVGYEPICNIIDW